MCQRAVACSWTLEVVPVSVLALERLSASKLDLDLMCQRAVACSWTLEGVPVSALVPERLSELKSDLALQLLV